MVLAHTYWGPAYQSKAKIRHHTQPNTKFPLFCVFETLNLNHNQGGGASNLSVGEAAYGARFSRLRFGETWKHG